MSEVAVRKTLYFLGAIAMCAVRVHGGATTDAVRQAIEHDLPAKLQTFECPETADDTKGLFYCTGSFADGRWFDVLARRQPDQAIEIIKQISFPPASESVALVARNGVTSDFANVQCPPQAGITQQEFDCSATLVDGSRLTIHGARYFEGRIAMDPFTWNPDSPSPLIRMLRSAARSGAIESITCPYDLTGMFDCAVHYAGGRSNAYTVRHTGQRFAILADLGRRQRTSHALGAAAIAAGLLAVIGGVIWLVALNVRSVVVELPFASEQPVDMTAAGRYVLHVVFPAFTFIPFWRRLQYSMNDAMGRDVPMYVDPFPTRSSFANVRRSVRLFSIDAAGKYRLRTAGVPPDYDASRWGLMITRSFLGRGIFSAVLIVAGAMTVLVGFIFVNS